jgi:hypothetical protein
VLTRDRDRVADNVTDLQYGELRRAAGPALVVTLDDQVNAEGGDRAQRRR